MENPKAQKARKNKSESDSIEITVPIGPPARGYVTDRVEVTSLTVEQKNALNRLTTGLRLQSARCQRRDARTPEGRVVDSEIDAVRWLLDQVALGTIGTL
jgi:hypothetical protein